MSLTIVALTTKILARYRVWLRRRRPRRVNAHLRGERDVYNRLPERRGDEGMIVAYFFWSTLSTLQFRGWIDDLLKTSWEACQGTDVLVESPSAMAGYHIAEALRIPYFRAFTMTWSRTRQVSRT